MTRKVKVTFSGKQKLEYAKRMVEGGYRNIQVEKISGAGQSAVSRWKQHYLVELNGNTPVKSKALTPEQQRIQELEAQLKRAQRDNDILKKAAAYFYLTSQSPRQHGQHQKSYSRYYAADSAGCSALASLALAAKSVAHKKNHRCNKACEVSSG